MLDDLKIGIFIVKCVRRVLLMEIGEINRICYKFIYLK